MAMRRERERDRDREKTEHTGPRRHTRYLDPNAVVDVNDIEMLRRFVTEYGKIVPSRLTGVTAAQQRDIKRGVRRARNMGMLA
jgi:small subunit ribosomal protein S18